MRRVTNDIVNDSDNLTDALPQKLVASFLSQIVNVWPKELLEDPERGSGG